jgi:hypothetical protein
VIVVRRWLAASAMGSTVMGIAVACGDPDREILMTAYGHP